MNFSFRITFQYSITLSSRLIYHYFDLAVNIIYTFLSCQEKLLFFSRFDGYLIDLLCWQELCVHKLSKEVILDNICQVFLNIQTI